ncbi:MAG: NAD-dependent epimerase/dehydratase family protein [Spirochaetales bacterium]|nr:NAD-dependent epimerase/dehydratase family protein [Spirochaetales bacterium]
MKILVTGIAGFIGFHVAKHLATLGHDIVGLDNLNDYYDPFLKKSRLRELGIRADQGTKNKNERKIFYQLDITDADALEKVFDEHQFDAICHLAAQAGVRYSIENPRAYIDSNLVGFFNVLDQCRLYNIPKLVYASSSSVYGSREDAKFSETDITDSPESLYAATKKSNELMASAYSKVYGMDVTGLRFFTVYGPWGRPDMAPMLFTKAIIAGEAIKVFNHGNVQRDFTYIDDIVEGIIRVLLDPIHRCESRVFNIGCSQPVSVLNFIKILEKRIGKSANMKMFPKQVGDVISTFADVSLLAKTYNYQPSIDLEKGINSFIDWYKHFYSNQ